MVLVGEPLEPSSSVDLIHLCAPRPSRAYRLRVRSPFSSHWLIKRDLAFKFLHRESENASNTRTPGDITSPLMAQYLTLFGREPHATDDPFAELLDMPSSARYVWRGYT